MRFKAAIITYHEPGDVIMTYVAISADHIGVYGNGNSVEQAAVDLNMRISCSVAFNHTEDPDFRLDEPIADENFQLNNRYLKHYLNNIETDGGKIIDTKVVELSGLY
jgi:hypothetical protein